ncbi:MAG: glycosyltransferase [Phycisphaerales bacterium]|nr:MAG: glycosyltransferase family 1 protein [Phycisphaerales bacterium]
MRRADDSGMSHAGATTSLTGVPAASGGAPPALQVWRQFESRYSLLDAMVGEIVEAFAACGWRVVEQAVHGPRLVLALNFPSDFDAFLRWARPADPACGVAHLVVDHPFALPTGTIERLCTLPAYRLFMTGIDDRHLLGLRFPTIRHFTCMHGVPTSALADEREIEPSHSHTDASRGGRDLGVVVAGSIHSVTQIEDLVGTLPASLVGVAREAARVLVESPGVTFTQAMDLVGPPGLFAVDQWRQLAAVWRVAIAIANRERRLALVRALRGLPVTIVGGEAWDEVCDGTTVRLGSVDYAQLPGVLRRARVCVAWGATQFAMSTTERPLLSMASGCATIAEDRVVLRREFGSDGHAESSGLALYDARVPERARELAETMLADPSACAVMGYAGRERIAAAHLWRHRVRGILSAYANVPALAGLVASR